MSKFKAYPGFLMDCTLIFFLVSEIVRVKMLNICN